MAKKPAVSEAAQGDAPGEATSTAKPTRKPRARKVAKTTDLATDAAIAAPPAAKPVLNPRASKAKAPPQPEPAASSPAKPPRKPRAAKAKLATVDAGAASSPAELPPLPIEIGKLVKNFVPPPAAKAPPEPAPAPVVAPEPTPAPPPDSTPRTTAFYDHGLNHGLSPVDLPIAAEGELAGLSWMARILLISSLSLLLFNSFAIDKWARALPVTQLTGRIVDAAAAWHAAMDRIDFNLPLETGRIAWHWVKDLQWPSGDEPSPQNQDTPETPPPA